MVLVGYSFFFCGKLFSNLSVSLIFAFPYKSNSRPLISNLKISSATPASRPAISFLRVSACKNPSQNQTLLLLLLLLPCIPCRWTEYCTDRFVKHIFQAFLSVFFFPTKLHISAKKEEMEKEVGKTYVRLEASKYLTAPISLAHRTPISKLIGWKRRSFRREMVTASSRRSSLVPMRRMGVVGAWWRISGIHCGQG